MVKNLQCLKTLQICYLRHAEHHAKNRTCLRGLDHDTLFFEWPVILYRTIIFNLFVPIQFIKPYPIYTSPLSPVCTSTVRVLLLIFEFPVSKCFFFQTANLFDLRTIKYQMGGNRLFNSQLSSAILRTCVKGNCYPQSVIPYAYGIIKCKRRKRSSQNWILSVLVNSSARVLRTSCSTN